MALLICTECSTRFAAGLEVCPQCGSADYIEEGAGPMLPMIGVACSTVGCRAAGKTQSVRLPPVGVNLVQIPAIACALCGHAVKTVTPWPLLPVREGEDMPKITRHGGPSNAAEPVFNQHNHGGNAVQGVNVTQHAPEAKYEITPLERVGTGNPEYVEGIAPESEGGEEPSPGSSSETSTAKPPTKPEPTKPARRKPARTTASRSKKDQTGSSTAHGTGGDQTEPTSETGTDDDG